jgi:hypothetical protein
MSIGTAVDEVPFLVDNYIPMIKGTLHKFINLKKCYEEYSRLQTSSMNSIKKTCLFGNLFEINPNHHKFRTIFNRINAFNTNIIDIYNKNNEYYVDDKCDAVSFSLYRASNEGPSEKKFQYVISTLLNALKTARKLRGTNIVVKIYLSFNSTMMKEEEYDDTTLYALKIVYSVLNNLLTLGNVELHHIFQPNLLEPDSLESNYEIIGRQRLFRFLPMVDGTTRYLIAKDIDSVIMETDIVILDKVRKNPKNKMTYINIYHKELGKYGLDPEDIDYYYTTLNDRRWKTDYSDWNYSFLQKFCRYNDSLPIDNRVNTKDYELIRGNYKFSWTNEQYNGNILYRPPWFFTFLFLNRDINMSMNVPAGVVYLNTEILTLDYFNNVYKFVRDRVDLIKSQVRGDPDVFHDVNKAFNIGFDEIFLANLFTFLNARERSYVSRFIELPASQQIGYASSTVEPDSTIFVYWDSPEQEHFENIEINLGDPDTLLTPEYTSQFNSYKTPFDYSTEDMIKFLGGKKKKKSSVRKPIATIKKTTGVHKPIGTIKRKSSGGNPIKTIKKKSSGRKTQRRKLP